MLSSGRSRTVSLGEEGAAGLERMEMEEVGLSEDFEFFSYQNWVLWIMRYWCKCMNDTSQGGCSSSLSSSSDWEAEHSDGREEGEVINC